MNLREIIIKWVLFFLLSLLIAVMLMLSGCSTTHKTKSISKLSVDSSSVVKIDSVSSKTSDSVSFKKDNTVTTVEKQDDYEKETVIEFDHIPDTGKMVIYGTPAEDYFPPIRKITIKEKGVKKEKTAIVANVIDSSRKLSTETGSLSEIRNSKVIKQEIIKDKEVKRRSYWGLLWLLLLIPAYIVYRNWGKIRAMVPYI